MSYTYKINEIDLNKLSYDDIKVSHNKKYIHLVYSDNQKRRKLIFQTPDLINIMTPIKQEGYYELCIPLSGIDKNKVSEFSNFLNDLDEKMIKDGNLYKNIWFNDSSSEILYKSLIRDMSNYNVIKIKILINDHQPIIRYNNSNINPYEIPQNCYIKMIIDCYGVWITKKNNTIVYGLFFKPLLINVKDNIKEKIEFRDSEENISIPDTEIIPNINLSDEIDMITTIFNPKKEENNNKTEKLEVIKEEKKIDYAETTICNNN